MAEGKGTEIELKNLGEKTGIKLIADDQGRVVIATEENIPLQPVKPDGKLDETALHDDQANEFSALTEKGSPAATDLVAIEDSEAGFVKKKVAVGNIGGGGASSFLGLTDTPNSYDGSRAFLVGVEDVATPDEIVFVDPSGLPVATHSHVEADITDLGSYAEASHAHVEADITDLGAYLDQAAADALYSPLGHSHTEADISDLDHTDADALHLSIDAEFAGLTEKATPAAADKVLIEDSAASGEKKWAPFSAFGGGGGSTAFDIPHVAPWSGNTINAQVVGVQTAYGGPSGDVLVAAGSFIQNFSDGTERTGEEVGEEFTKLDPPHVRMSKDYGSTWTTASSNVWAERLQFSVGVEGPGQHIVMIEVNDGWQAIQIETWVVIQDPFGFGNP